MSTIAVGREGETSLFSQGNGMESSALDPLLRAFKRLSTGTEEGQASHMRPSTVEICHHREEA